MRRRSFLKGLAAGTAALILGLKANPKEDEYEETLRRAMMHVNGVPVYVNQYISDNEAWYITPANNVFGPGGQIHCGKNMDLKDIRVMGHFRQKFDDTGQADIEHVRMEEYVDPPRGKGDGPGGRWIGLTS
jgi:hypothetical protein